MVMPGIVLAIGLGVIHGFASQLPIETFISRHRWTSFAGGVSLGYVFLEIFPELSHAQEELLHSKAPFPAYLENHIYLLALLGVVVFYGLNKAALTRRVQKPKAGHEAHHPEAHHPEAYQSGIHKTDVHRKHSHPEHSHSANQGSLFFWVHILAFALLNGILGYLLQDLAQHSLLSCILLFLTLALHLFIVDEGLREHHRAIYDRVGRWVLVGAIMVGMVLGQSWHLNEAAVSLVWSFLAGSIILNVLNRELPPEKETCLSSFVAGSLLFTVLLNLR